ncbi:MAG TPA: protein-tyrosine kinase, partial [Lachnospiraceae bacterium]|nr:protein-tyrosine kinase [Lachnospiraceae bacterium]
MAKSEEAIEINLGELLFYLLKKWYWMVLALVLGLFVGLSVSTFIITPQYTSTTKIIVLSRSGDDTNGITASDLQISNYLTKDYQELIVSRDVLEPVIRELNLADTYESLNSRISVSNIDNTRIISITVTDPDPQTAQKIATSVRDTAAEHIKDVTDVQAV